MNDKKEKNIAILIFGFLIIAFVLAFNLNIPLRANAETKEDLQDQIASLIKTINELTSQLQILEEDEEIEKNIVPREFAFDKNLMAGSLGDDVLYLQKILNINPETQIADGGAGSPGNETKFFGSRTRRAVMKFQAFYGDEVLGPLNLSEPTGLVGPKTRQKLNEIIEEIHEEITPDPLPPAAAGSLIIMETIQPPNSLAPNGAARIPFIKITLKAGTSSPAIINSFKVQRTGLAGDSVLNSVALLDEDESRIGAVKPLDLNHMAEIGERIIINSGETRTFTVAGNVSNDLLNFSGKTVGLSIEKIYTENAENSITGNFPIVGAMHTINPSINIGTAMLKVDSKRASSTIRDIGIGSYVFSSIIAEAGSEEDLKIKFIKWRLSGTALKTDVSNISTEIDNKDYPAKISADGKYYISIFSEGILIPKNTSKEIMVKGNIENGGGRTILFNIEKAEDVGLIGESFGFGVLPRAGSMSLISNLTAEFTINSMPFFHGAATEISGAKLRVAKTNNVPSQNIGTEVLNQPLGGVKIIAASEAVNIQSIKFNISITRSAFSTASISDIENIILTNQSGEILAGPVRAKGLITIGSAEFLSPVNIPKGESILILKGMLNNNFKNNDKVLISINPALNLKTKGVLSGAVISASPFRMVSSNPMEIKDSKITLTLSEDPFSQNIPAGAKEIIFANFIFDASLLDEDMKLNSLPTQFSFSGNPRDISRCRIFKGSEPLVSELNAVSPSSNFNSGSSLMFNFDTPFIIPKASIITLTLKCNVSENTLDGNFYRFGLSGFPVLFSVSTGGEIPVKTAQNAGNFMTVIRVASFSVSKSPAVSAYKIYNENENAEVGILRFSAVNDDIKITQVGLKIAENILGQINFSSNLGEISLWNDNKKIGIANFAENKNSVVVSLTEDFIIPANGSKDLIIKAMFLEIGPNKAGRDGAFVKIDYDGLNPGFTKGVALNTGTDLISSSKISTDFFGAVSYKSNPIFIPDNMMDSKLENGQDKILMRFKIKANDAGDVGIYKFTLKTQASGVKISGVNIYSFTDAGYSLPAPGLTDGKLSFHNKNLTSKNQVEIYSADRDGKPNPLQITKGNTYYFEVRGVVTETVKGSSLITEFSGDPKKHKLKTLMGTIKEIDADDNDNFLWTPNANGLTNSFDSDWTNGYGVEGLSRGMISQTLRFEE